ncbi:DUF748 domain-containing protein [Pseudozobellia thermophila]|uniref:DUF748 domain-containing protein n=1 Tax=Pseudozobellia thermophila TaxID=192903 RepID=A0A1M6BCL4_9FLAO|nr:DUF748 domain-containing protein [Pseudozobellia thermophila]SHI46455.1 protein of unknown function [Pseudozobellia thermophila]
MKGIFANKEIKGPRNRTLRVLTVIVGLGLLLFGGLQWYASHKVSDMLANGLPRNMEVAYGDMDINILLGSIGFTSLNCKLYRGQNKEPEVELVLGALEIKGLDYISLWSKEFGAHRVKLENAQVTWYDEESGELGFSLEKGRLELSEFKTDSLLLRQKIPFTYNTLNFEGNGLFLKLSPFETLTLGSVVHKDRDAEFKDLRITTRYSRDQLSQQLKKERDHIDLCLPSGSVGDLDLGTVNDSLYLGAKAVGLQGPELRLFRDKLLPDDQEEKPLYGSLLRNLPIKLDIARLTIEDALVAYTERIKRDVVPVSVSFDRLSAGIRNLTNTNDGKTEIEAKAFLMDEAPIQLQWALNNTSTEDRFNASVILKNLEAEAINPFLESQARVRAKGHIDEMYLTLSGDDFTSRGDMKMKYRDFKFSVLDEDRLGVDKALTLIVNLMTNDGSKTDEKGYRHGQIEVERDRSKSFFNYLWLNVRDGLKNTVVGNGKKE